MKFAEFLLGTHHADRNVEHSAWLCQRTLKKRKDHLNLGRKSFVLQRSPELQVTKLSAGFQ